MITINDQTHNKVLKLMESLELDISNLLDENYEQDIEDSNYEMIKLRINMAHLEGARKVFDIINGNN
tara:strand:+ start:2586 stop:2786 length:201 start_codon:yes stop_codon:yes gene_type:complete